PATLAHCHTTPVEAVDLLYHTGGVTALCATNPPDRLFRDIHTINQRMSVAPNTYEQSRRVLLGRDPGVPSFRARLAFGDETVADAADLLDLHLVFVAVLEELRRRAPRADAGRRAGKYEVAGLHRHDHGQVLDQRRHVEDKVSGA